MEELVKLILTIYEWTKMELRLPRYGELCFAKIM